MSLDHVAMCVLFALVLLSIALSLRVLAWVRQTDYVGQEAAEEWNPELEIGAAAPTFRAKLVDGTRVTERTFGGQHVAYVFLSPNCDSCRFTLPKVQEFAPAALERGTRLVVVTDTGIKQTAAWLDEALTDGALNTPVISASLRESKMVQTYDGPGFFPYYCFVDAAGIVRGRGLLGSEEWMALTEAWAGRGELPFPHSGAGALADAR